MNPQLTNNSPNVNELLRLDGRRALVTGASGNIGRGIALRLAEAGARIVAHYRSDESAATALVDEIVASGGQCSAVQADLASADGVNDLFDHLRQNNDVCDLVVNNAALQTVAALLDIEHSDWRAMMAANLDGPFLVTRLAAASMIEAGVPGSIVNVSSIEGQDPAVGHGHYAASKAGLAMLTKAAALELGASAIRVNAVSPGLIDQDGLAADWPEGVERWLSRAPAGRLGTAADVADAVLFLLSPAARWITGANLTVDGGMSTVSRW